MSCATATIKYLVFIFNTLCAIFGIGTIVVSSLALQKVDEDQRWICIFLIVVGSVVFLISFFGCCGAIKENICLTWTYAILMIILFTAGCVLLFGYLEGADEAARARKNIDLAWKQELNGTDGMTTLQSSLHCCGISGPSDYPHANLTIPKSCYPTNSTNGTYYAQGCYNKLVDYYKQTLHFVKIFSWISISVEGVAFICASILAINFANQERRSRY